MQSLEGDFKFQYQFEAPRRIQRAALFFAEDVQDADCGDMRSRDTTHSDLICLDLILVIHRFEDSVPVKNSDGMVDF